MAVNMALEGGMNENACQSHSLSSRLVCAQCWCEPSIKSVSGSEVLTITASCHGKEETRTIEKSKLVFTQKFFEHE